MAESKRTTDAQETTSAQGTAGAPDTTGVQEVTVQLKPAAQRAAGADTTTDAQETDHGIYTVAAQETTGAQETVGSQGITNAQKQIVSKLDVNKIADWKKTLSGALDDQRLFWALFVLGIFYIIYIPVSAIYSKDNAEDEDSVTELCECNPHHRSFYIVWLVLCSFLWAICHSLVLIVDSKDFFKKVCCQCSENNPSNDSRSWCKFELRQSDKADSWPWLCGCCCRKSLLKIYDKFQHYILDNRKLSRYEYYLWTQYCELYVIGVTKNTENFNIDRVEAIIKEALKSSKLKQQLKKKTEVDSRVAHDTTVVLPKYHNKKCTCRFIVQIITFFIIKFIQYLAQLSIVPLLIIQMFDTYAFLCFAADNYCSTKAQYDLHLHQTFFTFGFYLALMTSLLSTTTLRWIHCPETPPEKTTEKTESKV